MNKKWKYYEIWHMNKYNWDFIYYKIRDLIGPEFPNYRSIAIEKLTTNEFIHNTDLLYFLFKQFNKYLIEYGFNIRVVIN